MEVTILNKQSNNIQDIFLNNARKTKTTVSIYLVIKIAEKLLHTTYEDKSYLLKK